MFQYVEGTHVRGDHGGVVRRHLAPHVAVARRVAPADRAAHGAVLTTVVHLGILIAAHAILDEEQFLKIVGERLAQFAVAMRVASSDDGLVATLVCGEEGVYDGIWFGRVLLRVAVADDSPEGQVGGVLRLDVFADAAPDAIEQLPARVHEHLVLRGDDAQTSEIHAIEVRRLPLGRMRLLRSTCVNPYIAHRPSENMRRKNPRRVPPVSSPALPRQASLSMCGKSSRAKTSARLDTSPSL